MQEVARPVPTPAPAPVRFQWVTSAAGLAALRPAWEALLDDGPGAIFRTWEWQASWWETFADEPRRRRALRVLTVRAGDDVRAILPLYVEDAPVARLVPRRRAAFLADGVVGSDFLGLIARAEDQARLAPLVAARLAVDPVLADVDLFDLTDLAEGDPFAAAFARALGGTRAARYRCPYARFEGRDLAAWLAARPNGFGRQLRDRRRQLERARGFAIETHEAPDAVVAALETLFRLHRLRWAADGGSQAIPSPRVEEFHRRSARRLAERGWARLTVLRAEGADVAAGYGFSRGKRFDYYQAGLDPAWRRRHAGVVVLGEMIARAFAEGCAEVDFLRGEEPYKRIWGDAARETQRVRAFAPTAAGRRAALADRGLRAVRSFAKDRLPPRAARVVRAAARRLGL